MWDVHWMKNVFSDILCQESNTVMINFSTEAIFASQLRCRLFQIDWGNMAISEILENLVWLTTKTITTYWSKFLSKSTNAKMILTNKRKLIFWKLWLSCPKRPTSSPENRDETVLTNQWKWFFLPWKHWMGMYLLDEWNNILVQILRKSMLIMWFKLLFNVWGWTVDTLSPVGGKGDLC